MATQLRFLSNEQNSDKNFRRTLKTERKKKTQRLLCGCGILMAHTHSLDKREIRSWVVSAVCRPYWFSKSSFHFCRLLKPRNWDHLLELGELVNLYGSAYEMSLHDAQQKPIPNYHPAYSVLEKWYGCRTTMCTIFNKLGFAHKFN